jgi:MFS family permease
MLSVMLGMGVVSRLGSGLIADRIGGVGTLILGSVLQCLTLLFYIPFNGLTSLYIVSALFGLSQGGIVPSYALIVRQYFPARQAGVRVSLVLMSTVIGMAIGGWMTGLIFDWTGSYSAAFLNGIAWNLLNMSIAVWLLMGKFRGRTPPAAQPA